MRTQLHFNHCSISLHSPCIISLHSTHWAHFKKVHVPRKKHYMDTSPNGGVFFIFTFDRLTTCKYWEWLRINTDRVSFGSALKYLNLVRLILYLDHCSPLRDVVWYCHPYLASKISSRLISENTSSLKTTNTIITINLHLLILLH